MKKQKNLNTTIFFLFTIFALTFSAKAQMSGDLDLTFGNSGKYQNGFGNAYDEARAVAVQTDGKIVVAGVAGNFGANDFAIVRYNADGSLDTSFGNNGVANADIVSNDTAYALAIQPDGKIVAAGDASGRFALARFNSDGSLDTTFDGDGKFNTIVGVSSVAFAVTIQTDGKIVAAGRSYSGTNNDFGVIRLNPNGSFDSTFGTAGKVTTAFGSGEEYARAVAIQSDGKIVVAGDAALTNFDFAVARYNSDGSLDTTFDGDGKVTTSVASSTSSDGAYTLAIQTDNKIVVGGSTNLGAGLVRYNANGSLDTTFDGDGKRVNSLAGNIINSIRLQADGKIVAFGSMEVAFPNSNFSISRYNSNGSLDTSFDSDGMATADFGVQDLGYSLAMQSDGKFVVVGRTATPGNSSAVFYNFALARFDTNGSLDTTFDTDGKKISDVGNFRSAILSLAFQPDGKIVAAGYSATDNGDDFGVVRFNTNGTLDNSFGVEGKATISLNTFDRAQAVAVQADGKIVTAGYAQSGSAVDFALVRYNAVGTLDTTFDTDGIVTTPIGTTSDYGYAMALQPDGKILVGGYAQIGTTSDFALVRYNTNGSLDTTFGTGGKVTTAVGASLNDRAYTMTLQSDGKIIQAGISGNNFAVVRYNTNGSLDTSFDTDGIVTTAIGAVNFQDIVYSIALQTDGKIVAAGESYNGSNRDWAVARYNADGSPDTTFDIDGNLITTFGIEDEIARSVVIQSDGKIVVAGDAFGTFNQDFAMARYNPNGSLDTTFSLAGRNHGFDSFVGDGKLTVDFGLSSDRAYALAIDADERLILVGETARGFGITRIIGAAPPTAANVSVSGRVFTSDGRGLRNAVVQLTDANGATRTVRTSSFGYYSFDEIPAGQTYIISVISKRYVFNPQVISVAEDISDLDFIALSSDLSEK